MKTIAPKNTPPVWNASALHIRRAWESLGKAPGGLTYETMANEMVKMIGPFGAWTLVMNQPIDGYTYEEWGRYCFEENERMSYTHYYVPTIGNWMEACRMTMGATTALSLSRCKELFTL